MAKDLSDVAAGTGEPNDNAIEPELSASGVAGVAVFWGGLGLNGLRAVYFYAVLPLPRGLHQCIATSLSIERYGK